MDRLTRHELKTDHFAEEVGHTVEWLGLHRRQAIQYGGIALAVIAIAAGAYYWTAARHRTRQADLAEALRNVNAAVGTAPNEAYKVFPTAEEKDKAVVKGLAEVAARHAGSMEGDIATYLLGTHAIDKGRLPEAETNLKTVAGEGEKEYAALAKLALADLYATQNKIGEAEKLLRPVIDSPAVSVSKEAASLALARILKESKPEEARKLLDPLRTGTGAASRQAIALLGELPPAPAAKK